MSEARDMMADVVADRASAITDSCKNLRTGATFQAEIEPIQDISLNTELGMDPRASTWFYLSDETVDIAAGDKIQALGVIFKILPSAAPVNSANVMAKYLAMQLTTSDT